MRSAAVARYGALVGTPVSAYVVRRPPPSLRAAVVHYCGYRLSGFDPGVHVGLPSPHLTLILTLDDPVAVRWPGGSGRLHAMVGGLHDHPVEIEHDGSQFGIELALTPLGCRGLFGAPAAAVARSVVPLDALFGSRASELLERAAAAGTWAARFAAVDRVLTAAVDTAPPVVRPEVRAAWRHLLVTRGRAAVSAVADDLGWSRRHLGEQFRREVGLAPKTVARMVRFHHAQRLLRAADGPSIGTVAAVTGYADQSHMTREWQAFVGAAPATWLASEQFPSVQDDGDPAPAS